MNDTIKILNNFMKVNGLPVKRVRYDKRFRYAYVQYNVNGNIYKVWVADKHIFVNKLYCEDVNIDYFLNVCKGEYIDRS